MSQSKTTSASLDSPEVIAQIERYQQLARADRPAARQQLIDQFPTLADDLTACLKGLELMADVGPQIASDSQSTADRAGPWGHSPEHLGDFRIVREIGRGGMGVVYEAEQRSLRRRVAIKVLPFASFLDERRLRRFQQEAQTAALLTHPNIVSVYCVGQERGVYYYAMELIEGQSLAELICQLQTVAIQALNSGDGHSVPTSAVAERDNSSIQEASMLSVSSQDTDTCAILSTQRNDGRAEYFRAIARLGQSIASALHFAHEQGIVHRDIKPSNLLLGRDGRISIADFGLAHVQRDTGEDSFRLTMPGDILGTLRYMSPEQAAGGIVCDHRIDIYALGVTLYELVTLRPAVDARDRATAMRQVTEQTPTRPRKHDRRIPLDLERILLHAMAKRAEDRYQSAREMAADLQNFLEQKPVLARRASHLSQMRGWLRRNRLIATCLTSVLCLLITLAVSGPFVAMSYSRMAQNERAARQMADANAKELRQVLAKALVRESAVEGQRLSASELRRKLSEDAVVYYERLLQRNPRDETTRFEAANAKSNLASWQYQAQDPSSALTTRKQAVGLLRELSIEFPTSDEYRFELAHNYRVLASDLKYPPVQDFEAAAEYARQAVVIGEALAVKSPSNLDYLQEMNGSYVESARVFMDSRQYDKAESMLLKAVASARQSVDRFPDDPDARCMEGWSRSNLGQLYVVQTRYAEAEEILKAGEAAYAEHYRSVKYYPEGYRLAYVDCSVTRGACLYRMRRANEAAMCLSAARERLIEIDRSSALLNWVLGAQQRLNITWVDVLIAQHNLGEAEVCLRQMIGSDAHKSDHEVTVDGTHMTAMFELARLLWFTDKYDESRRLCHEISQHLEHSPTQFRSFRPRFLTQCPFPEWHDPQLAVALINERPSTENQPWELLSVAQYQCGDLPGAQQSLVRTMDAHHGGDAFDFLRMAIIERRLNQESSSLRWYDKAEAARNEVWYSQYFKYPDEWESLQTEYREAVACR